MKKRGESGAKAARNMKRKNKKSGKKNIAKRIPRTASQRGRSAAAQSRPAKRNFTLVGEAFRGTFRSSGRGYGFITTDVSDTDFFVPPDFTSFAMDGDTVEAKRLRQRSFEGKGSEAAVTGIVSRAHTTVIGTLHTGHGISWVSADDLMLGCAHVTDFAISAPEGDKVELEITKYPGDYRPSPRRSRSAFSDTDMPELTFCGKVISDLGPAQSLGANYEAILRDCGINIPFPDNVIAEAESRSAEKLTPDGRLDLRDKIIFTIDGADAKDLDDAISLEKCGSGWLLGVHIADVSHYVVQDSVTDIEALGRGTSVYFTDKVVPMLPVSLSNGACSLNAGTDKYALSALIRLDENAEITGYEFAQTIIRSAVRGVYSEINDIFEAGEKSPFARKYASVLPMLGDMLELYHLLDRRSSERGALELDSKEAYILLGEDGLPSSVVPRIRGDAEKLIEQFMLCANIAAARFMSEKNLNGVYRIHESPDPDKLRTFAIFAHNLGLDTSALGRADGEEFDLNEHAGSREISKVISEAEEKGISEIVSAVMLRSMMKAKYSPKPSPHFGLAAPLYCHFTSPIRRYPDLFVHWTIKAYLNGMPGPSPVRAADAARISSDREICAQTAERRIEALYMALWMREHLGEEFDAAVSGVSRFGVFCRTEMLCEGLIPAISLGDVTEYNERTFTLTVNTGRGVRVFRLGERLKVRAEAADAISAKITFSLVEP